MLLYISSYSRQESGLDWPTFSELCTRTLAALEGRDFVRALVTSTGTILVTDENEEIHLPEFRCRATEPYMPHFTASVIERAGFGTHIMLKALLTHCDELLAFRHKDQPPTVYTRTRGSPRAGSAQ